MNTQTSDTISVADAAKRLGISREATYRAVKNGQVPGSFKVGGRILVKRAVFDDFLTRDQEVSGEHGRDDG